MANDRELGAMRLAIALSARGLGTTSPNPPVGCVILDANGAVVGTGYHRRKGEPHAEAHALREAGDRAKGGTALVTLEPCNHIGRTPACRQGLLDAEIGRVVVALIDPTSRGEGGAAVLREAGVDVEVGVLADEARVVLRPWLDALMKGRPEVTAIVKPEGLSSHDPWLAAERIAVDAVLFADGRVEEGVPGAHGRGILKLPGTPLVDQPSDVLAKLYSGGVRSVLLETDAQRLCEYTAAGCLDRVVVLVAPDDEIPALPSGFRIAKVDRATTGLRVELAPEVS